MTLTPSRAYRVLGIWFAAFSAVCAFGALRAHWTKPVDFDVIGFLWVIQNAGPIGAWALALLFLVFAVYFLIRAWGSS
jgi:hypothetical protein